MFSFFSPTSYGNSIVADCSVTSCHLFIIFFSIYKDFIFYRNLYFRAHFKKGRILNSVWPVWPF